MIPTSTVVRLKTKLRNQKILTRMADGVGEKGGGAWLAKAPKAGSEGLSSLAAMCTRALNKLLSGSGCRFLYDSIAKPVTTAEKSPACQH